MKISELSLIKTSIIDEKIQHLKSKQPENDSEAACILSQIKLLDEIKSNLTSASTIINEVVDAVKYAVEDSSFVDNYPYDGGMYVNIYKNQLDKDVATILNRDFDE